ncbi:ABC transporter substrate-binding protein [Clostridium sp.]|uniref:ABC transporter substrate-binding protein n=1 Tax=Clostridium sp. TaxID=1506 RepID=UPI0032167C16
MKNKKQLAILLIVCLICSVFIFIGCGNSEAKEEVVTLYGWGGDERVNTWIDTKLAPYVKENHNIKLNRVPMNIDEVLLKLTNEKSSTEKGSIDVIWLNGENFYYAKKNKLLNGPFVSELENAKKYVDLKGNAATTDFGYPTEGYEAPWGTAQFVFNYDSEKINTPPTNSKALKEYVMNNPGRFTYPQSSDFTGSAFIRTVLYDIIGYENLKDLPADYDTVKGVMTPALKYFKEIEQYLWKKGEVYPTDSAQLDGLYQDGQVEIAMDYNANKALSKVSDNSWPESTKSFVWDKGTPFNTHYLAIAANSPNLDGALKVIDSALSAQMQISKADLSGWADLPSIEYDKLTKEEQIELDKNLTPEDEYKDTILSYEELSKHQLAELKSDLVVVIEKVWEDVILFDK